MTTTTNSKGGLMVTKLRAQAVKARAFVKGQTPSATQGAGLLVFAAGAYVLAPFLGLMVAGAFLCVVGWAIDK